MSRYFKTFSALLRDDMTRYWHHSVPFIHKEVGLTFRPLVARWGGAGRHMRGGEWPVPCTPPINEMLHLSSSQNCQNVLSCQSDEGRWTDVPWCTPCSGVASVKALLWWWSYGMQLRMVTRFLVSDYGRGRLKGSQKLLQYNFHQWHICDEACEDWPFISS